jgi:hypothetical protein
LTEVSDLTKLLGVENLARHQIETMIDDSGPHVIVTSLMTLINGAEQVHHVFKELASLVPLANLVDSFNNNLVDDLTCIPIDQHNPLIDEVPLRFKLNINSLKHLNRSHDVV